MQVEHLEAMRQTVTEAADSILEKYRRAGPAQLAHGEVLEWIIGDSRWHTIDSTTEEGRLSKYRQLSLTWFGNGVKINFGLSLNETTVSLLPMTIEHVQTGGRKTATSIGGKVTILSDNCGLAGDGIGEAITLLIRNIKWVINGTESRK